MKNLVAKEASQKRAGRISLIIGFVGVVCCFLPLIGDISVEEGGCALVTLGGLLALIGLLSARMLFNRAKLLKGLASGEGILSRWTYDSPQDAGNREEFGEVTIGSSGVYACGEFYTFNKYSCRLENVSLISGSSPEIHFILSLPRKSGRHKQDLRVPVPAGAESIAAHVVNQLNQGR